MKIYIRKRIKKEFDDAKIEATKEFPQEQEYQEKSMRLQKLEKELNMTKETDTQVVGLEEKIEKIGDNVSECTVIAEEISHISEKRSVQSKADESEYFVQKSEKSQISGNKTIAAVESTDDYTERETDKIQIIPYDELTNESLETQSKVKREGKIKEINTDLSESILSKKVTELNTLEDETEIYGTITETEEKPDLEKGDIFEYEGRKWKVVSNNGFMLGAENVDKNSSTPFFHWIGNIKDHDYVLVSKSEKNKEDKNSIKERNTEKQPARNTGGKSI